MTGYRPAVVLFLAMTLAILRSFAHAENPAKAAAKRSGTELALGNALIELVFDLRSEHGAAVRLVNKLSGRTIPIRSDDFSIGLEGRAPLRAGDFAFKAARDEAFSGGQRVALRRENSRAGLELDVVYELGDRDFFIRRRLEVATKSPLALRQVDAWLVGVEGKCTHEGFGSPVLLEDTFWGLEFPAAENHYAGGVVKLTQFPGRTVSDRFTSKTAVVGVAEPGRTARWFQRYVETFRLPSSRTPLFVNYNTWWTLMPPTEKNCLELIGLFRRKLYEPYGESIDTFTLDHGWEVDPSLWVINPQAYPRGFAPLVKALAEQKARLGIWLSPSSGYNHAPFLSTHGYQANSNPWFICSSDPKYRRDIVKVVTDLTRQYNVAFFKFDGFCATCDAAGHAHLPGPYAREANVEAFIELMTSARRAQPEMYLDPTCGIWLSPWWLQYADSLWGEVSGDYPDIIVPAPIVRDSATTTRDGVFRQRCREHPGFPPAAIEHLGIIVISPEKWEDNAMIVVGRGARLLTLYIDPKSFVHGDRDWAFLASLLKWIRHNADLLRHTELILGDPMKREPYGYAHFRGARGILALRNPFIEPRTVQVKLDDSLGWSPKTVPGTVFAGTVRAETGEFRVRMVYPRHEILPAVVHFGDTLSLRLEGYETAILDVQPADRAYPAPIGVRYQETGREGNRVKYSVWKRPDKKMPGTSSTKVEGATLLVSSCESKWQIGGKCTVEVPAGTKAALHVLVDPRGTAPGVIQCAATVNGKPAAVRAVRTPSPAEQAHGPHPWTWFEFPVPEGQSEVAMTISPASKTDFFRGEVGWWLWAEHSLAKSTAVVQCDGALAKEPAEPLPLPIGNESERQIVTIQSPKLMRTGHRWPKEKPIVWLDQCVPDESSQEYGKVEINRSVWEKPMIVAGRKFARGLGAHANGRILYELSGAAFKTFRSWVGRDEHAGDGIVVFQVWVDGQKRFDSGPMTKATPARPVEVKVAGAATLELRALDGGDGISGDHANWAEAQLAR